MPKQEPQLYKDDFTIKQYAAFSLASNSAWHRVERNQIYNIKHFVDLKRQCFEEKQPDFDEVISRTISSVRNYFSHYLHESNEICDEEKWLRLVQIASQRIISKENKKFGKDEDEGEIKKFLTGQNLIQILFLTKVNCSHLWH